MAAGSSPLPERRSVQAMLPWVVGAAALALYLITLNHSVTLSSASVVRRVNGWDWQPMLSQPLLYLLMCPLGWLPAGWVPLALNVFTALCAALTLTALARSVALLPHDRMEQQRLLVGNEDSLLSLPDAWVPVVLAAVALGMQLTFWEHAVAASGEMLVLLLFAYVILCLLEYRASQRQSWLDRSAFLCGVAVANHWAMAGFLPLFVVALFWMNRWSFFSVRSLRRLEQSGWESVAPALSADLRFCLRMALLGLAGVSVFLLLPLVQSLSPQASLGLGQALKLAAAAYRETLWLLARVFLRYHRELAVLLASGSLLPVFLMSIRWGGLGDSQSRDKFDLATFVSHLSHALLLLICLWIIFDPPFSPRQIGNRNGISLPFLPLYYLTALSIGYYSGFFLLAFGPAARGRLNRRDTVRAVLYRVAPVFIYVLAGLTVAGLLVINAPVIRAANSPHLSRYARLAARSLPTGGAVVLCDDPLRMTIVLGELAREGKAGRYVPVELGALSSPAYRAWLSRKYPGHWLGPAPEPKRTAAAHAPASEDVTLDAAALLQLICRVGESNSLYCLQPRIGVLLEQFYLQPHGLLHEMKRFPPELFNEPLLTPVALAENQAFWDAAIEEEVKPVLRLAAQTDLPRPAIEQKLMKLAHLQTPWPAEVKTLAEWYSGALNRWGVTLQRSVRVSEAAPCFALARELSPDNLPAWLNSQCNGNLLARRVMTVDRSQSFVDEFDKHRDWNQVLCEKGPVDEPSYCYRLGGAFAAGGMPRQACQQFERVKILAPADVPARLALGSLLVNCMMPGRALDLAAEIRADPDLRPLALNHEVEVTMLEAQAWFVLTNRSRAQGIIYALLATHPGDALVQDRAVATFTACQSYSDALKIVGEQLQRTPNNPAALANQGSLRVLTGDFSNAIPPLTLSLSLTNTYAGRLSRAMACLRLGRLDAAAADYKALLQAFPAPYGACIGLVDIALSRGDTNTAIRYCEQYLALSETATEDARLVAARLKTLQPRAH